VSGPDVPEGRITSSPIDQIPSDNHFRGIARLSGHERIGDRNVDTPVPRHTVDIQKCEHVTNRASQIGDHVLVHHLQRFDPVLFEPRGPSCVAGANEDYEAVEGGLVVLRRRCGGAVSGRHVVVR